MNLREIQREQAVWSLHNFGPRPSWQPFVGMVEEVGELELSRWQRVEEFHDAVGDITIFMADFCTLEGFDLQDLYEASRDFAVNNAAFSETLLTSLAWVARGFLKKEQKVRGTAEENRDKMRMGLMGMLAHLDFMLIRPLNMRELPEVVAETWKEVRKRDWKLYPETGLPPAQEPAGSVSEAMGHVASGDV
jgi:hypothetical protein